MFDAEELVNPSITELVENHTAQEKWVWEYRIMKSERILNGNLCNLYAVLMSLRDSDMKNQVENNTEFTVL